MAEERVFGVVGEFTLSRRFELNFEIFARAHTLRRAEVEIFDPYTSTATIMRNPTVYLKQSKQKKSSTR